MKKIICILSVVCLLAAISGCAAEINLDPPTVSDSTVTIGDLLGFWGMGDPEQDVPPFSGLAFFEDGTGFIYRVDGVFPITYTLSGRQLTVTHLSEDGEAYVTLYTVRIEGETLTLIYRDDDDGASYLLTYTRRRSIEVGEDGGYIVEN